MRQQILGTGAIILAASLWAADGVVLRPILYSLPVFILIFIEHLLALGILSALTFSSWKELKTLKRGDWIAFGLVGLFGGVIGTYAITQAIFMVYAEGLQISVVLLLQKLQPIFAILLAWLWLKEHPTKNFFLWAVLAFIGSYILTFGFGIPVLSLSNTMLIASGYAILAAASWGCSTVFSKRALAHTSFLLGTWLRFAMTTLIAFIIVFFTMQLDAISQVSFNQWKTLLIIACTTGAAAIFIYYYGLKRVKASSSTIFEMAFPIVALLLEFYIQGTTIQPMQYVGVIILVFAILMLAREQHAFRSVSGKVVSGKKEGAYYVRLYSKPIEEHVGFKPYFGTLNLEIKESLDLFKRKVIKGFVKDGKQYGDVYYLSAKVNEIECAILLPKKSSHKGTIEIIAPVKLRNALSIKDSDLIKIDY